MSKSFLIAEDLQHAQRSVQMAGGWTRAGYGAWRDEADAVVAFTSNPKDLDGLPPGTVVFLGQGWRVRVTPADIVWFRTRGFVMEELT